MVHEQLSQVFLAVPVLPQDVVLPHRLVHRKRTKIGSENNDQSVCIENEMFSNVIVSVTLEPADQFKHFRFGFNEGRILGYGCTIRIEFEWIDLKHIHPYK